MNADEFEEFHTMRTVPELVGTYAVTFPHRKDPAWSVSLVSSNDVPWALYPKAKVIAIISPACYLVKYFPDDADAPEVQLVESAGRLGEWRFYQTREEMELVFAGWKIDNEKEKKAREANSAGFDHCGF
ncbi:TPA: hypothetical protein LU109_003594 [Enterobacter hormaechei subsp. xiangfangensis]|nr:hypothetical protein [Enterobacter hormaechei subsp. xiangfangensis]